MTIFVVCFQPPFILVISNNKTLTPWAERIKFWQGKFYLKGKGAYVVYVTAF